MMARTTSHLLCISLLIVYACSSQNLNTREKGYKQLKFRGIEIEIDTNRINCEREINNMLLYETGKTIIDNHFIEIREESLSEELLTAIKLQKYSVNDTIGNNLVAIKVPFNGDNSQYHGVSIFIYKYDKTHISIRGGIAYTGVQVTYNYLPTDSPKSTFIDALKSIKYYGSQLDSLWK